MRYLLTIVLTATLLSSTALAVQRVAIVAPAELDGPAAYGVGKLIQTLSERGVVVETVKTVEQVDSSFLILVGLSSQRNVAGRIVAAGLTLPKQPESLAVCRVDDGARHAVVLCGADAVGLMYAALDTAERIGWVASNEDLFAHVRNISESPYLTDRSISTYTMHRRLFEQRLYDPVYWEKYFDMLAKSRINSYVIVFGYENGGFMAPIYPYFFDVEKFPDVEFYGLTDEQQAKNTAALRRVIQLAHERGIRLTVGIWDHIYRGGVQSGGIAGASDLAGKYVAAIPGSFIVPEWDLMYFVEVIGTKGDGCMVPDLEKEMPYVIVPVERGN